MEIGTCRSPAFPLDAALEEVWEELKQKIKRSSPSFYPVIQKVNVEDLHQMNPNVRFTVWKYFNRAKYRATPFGEFAAITMVPIEYQPLLPLRITKKMKTADFRDWTEKEKLATDPRLLESKSQVLVENSSLYHLGNQVRYLRYLSGKFELATVESFSELTAVLETCSLPVIPSQIAKMLKADFQLSGKQALALIQQMIDMTLLLPSSTPNIIGEDYFQRMGVPRAGRQPTYQIATRQLSQGALDAKCLKNLPEMIQFLARHLPEQSIADLEEFKVNFHHKFETREVPLSLVMDPEVGVGYGNLETQLGGSMLSILKQQHPSPVEPTQLTYNPLLAFTLQKIIQGATIQLEQFESSTEESQAALPNTLSIMYHLHQGLPVIETAGGVSATALLGRFSPASTVIEEHVKALAHFEAACNPQVLFFDIGYQAENQIDNINRRKKIYPLELPILTWSCSEQPLDVHDIQVSVHQNLVYLRSKKLNKRLVPRLPSAYNYTRSDLALYRFLCDLQSQHLKTNLNFNPKTYFPGLDHYPRTCYKNIVLSGEMWLLSGDFLHPNTHQTHNEQVAELRCWLSEKKIISLIKVGNTDNTLCFNPNSTADLEHLLRYCHQQRDPKIYISEALIDTQGQLGDQNGSCYAGQYIANYCHSNTLYHPLDLPSEEPTIPLQQGIYLPGSEWLYYELFCYPTRSNALLSGPISGLLAQVKGYLKKWFFIRYDHPSPHLRLRLQLKDPSHGQLVTAVLKELIEPQILSGQLNDLTLRTYKQELHRYGAQRIEQIETLFHLDSKRALDLLSRPLTEEDQYARAVVDIIAVYLQGFPNFQQKEAFVQHMAKRFATEHKLVPIHFRGLNQGYHQIKDRLENQQNLPESGSLAAMIRAVNTALKGVAGQQLQQLLADLIHMHINRQFTTDQRLHEAVIYHYLNRYLQVYRARQGIARERKVQP